VSCFKNHIIALVPERNKHCITTVQYLTITQ